MGTLSHYKINGVISLRDSTSYRNNNIHAQNENLARGFPLLHRGSYSIFDTSTMEHLTYIVTEIIRPVQLLVKN